MGASLGKMIFSRKPRKYMSELKRIYGEELNLYLENKISRGEIHSYELTEAERYAIRKKILSEVRKDNQKRIFAIVLAVLIVIGIIIGLKYLILNPL